MAPKIDSTSAVVAYTSPNGCSRHCGRFVHVHPQSDSVAADLYKMAEISALTGGVMLKMSLDPTVEVSLISRALIAGSGGFTFLMGPGLFCAASGAAYVGEKIYNTLGFSTMELADQDVQDLREELGQQQGLLTQSKKAGDQLKVLTDDVLPALIGEVATIQTTVEAQIPAVSRIKTLYQQNKEVFNQASEALVLVETILTKPRSPMHQQNLELVVDWTHGISLEKQKTKELDIRVETLRNDIARKKAQLEQLQKQTQALSTVEIMQFNSLEETAEAYVKQAELQQKGSTDDRLFQPTSVVY